MKYSNLYCFFLWTIYSLKKMIEKIDWKEKEEKRKKEEGRRKRKKEEEEESRDRWIIDMLQRVHHIAYLIGFVAQNQKLTRICPPLLSHFILSHTFHS